ncbi:MAG: hypothetical protein ABSF22_01865, partial [Bryobacteraceae bacterium]
MLRFSRDLNAKARVSIYGSADVISALADFEKAGAMTFTQEQHVAFLAVVSAMRTSRSGGPQGR